MAGEVVRVSGALTESEFAKASFALTARRRLISLVVILLASGFASYAAIGNRATVHFSAARLLALAVVVALLIAVIVGSIVLGNLLSARVHFRSNRAIQGTITYTFSDEGIAAAGETSSGQTAWANIVSARETGFGFLIMPAKYMMYALPRRFFENEAQVGALRALLREHLGAKAKLSS